MDNVVINPLIVEEPVDVNAALSKVCMHCGEHKLLTEFRKAGKWYRNMCKICYKDRYYVAKQKFVCLFVKRDGSVCGRNCLKELCYAHSFINRKHQEVKPVLNEAV